MHLLHETLTREAMDIEANRARFVELFHKLRCDGDRADRDAAPPSTGPRNPLTQQSVSSLATERALHSVARIQQALRTQSLFRFRE